MLKTVVETGNEASQVSVRGIDIYLSDLDSYYMLALTLCKDSRSVDVVDCQEACAQVAQ